MRESRYLNGARETIGSSCAVSGTGFLFSQKILDECGGWPFHLLVEDIEFSIGNILAGHRIAFCRDAVTYDEQPTDFAQSCRQRLRWSRGYLQVFGKYGSGLIRGLLRGSWSCYDMAMAIMPAIVLTSVSLFVSILLAVMGIVSGLGVLPALLSLGKVFLGMYLTLFTVGLITTVTEWKHIDASPARKLFSVLTFPLFMFTYIPISFAALFMKVEWKPIRHTITAKELGRD